ncbi:hypothetical protein NC651_029018 [Populus alba x Populus x berolinensis]|nr:hypothetical protein NC651_029018 [Populus alba x Populus x berolinensis]
MDQRKTNPKNRSILSRFLDSSGFLLFTKSSAFTGWCVRNLKHMTFSLYLFVLNYLAAIMLPLSSK